MSTLASASFPKPKHLLVDLDGTLVNFWEFGTQLDFVFKVRRFFKEKRSSLEAKHGGLKFGTKRVLKAMRGMKEELDLTSETSIFKGQTNTERAARVFSSALGLEFNDGKPLLEETLNHVFPKLSRRFSPMPGAKEFIHWAKEKYCLTLATNPVWPQGLIEQRLKWGHLELSDFQGVTDGDRFHACKPTPEYYREVMTVFGGQNPKPEDFMLIGNDYQNDLPATLVGVSVFLIQSEAKVSPLKSLKGAKAPAFRGSFAALRAALEKGTL